MTVPKWVKPPYRIGPNSYLTTRESRPARPATGSSLVQRIASHLPVTVRGAKPPGPAGPDGDEATPRPSSGSAPRSGRLPARDVPSSKDAVGDFTSKLPDELNLQFLESLDFESWKSWRQVNRSAAEKTRGMAKHLHVRSGADVSDALAAFPAALSLSMLPKHGMTWNGHDAGEDDRIDMAVASRTTWSNHIDARAAEAIKSASRLESVVLVACGRDGLRDVHLATIAESQSLRELHAPYNAITWDGVEAVVRQGRVETADFSDNPICYAPRWRGTRSLGASQALRELTVMSCRLDNEDAAHLAASGSIVKLVARDNRFGPAAAAAFARNGARGGTLANGEPARAIEHIDLGCNPLGGTGVRALAATRTIRSMTLDRTSHPLDPVLDDAMQALAACASLQSLDLSNNGLDSDAPRHLAASESLEALRMGGNPLGDAGAGHLAHPEGLARIRILALDNCAIEDLGALALAAKPGLEELSLANRSRWTVNRITDTAGEAFASSRSLRKLDLAHCEVGNRTARRLAASQSLKDLGLSGTRVDDAGGTALAASETLRKVDLSGTNVGDETAIAMARNPVIRKLDLSGCPNITEKGRAALEAQRHRFEELRL